MPEEKVRNFTDDDIKAFVDEMEKRMVNRFYLNLGRGLWGAVAKVLIVGLITLAAYGSLKGVK